MVKYHLIEYKNYWKQPLVSCKYIYDIWTRQSVTKRNFTELCYRHKRPVSLPSSASCSPGQRLLLRHTTQPGLLFSYPFAAGVLTQPTICPTSSPPLRLLNTLTSATNMNIPFKFYPINCWSYVGGPGSLTNTSFLISSFKETPSIHTSFLACSDTVSLQHIKFDCYVAFVLPAVM